MFIANNEELVDFIVGIASEGREEFVWKDLVEEFDIELGKIQDLTKSFANTEFSNIDLRGFDTSDVENMSKMFNGCENLQKLDLSSFDTSNVKNMCYMFSRCENLQKLDLSSFDTSNVKNMCYMFSRCENLQGLDLSSFDTSNVKNMRHMFSNCRNLQGLAKLDYEVNLISGLNRGCIDDMKLEFQDEFKKLIKKYGIGSQDKKLIFDAIDAVFSEEVKDSNSFETTSLF